MSHQLPHLVIRSESGSSVVTHIELDGVDLASKLVGIELSRVPGAFWRAKLTLIARVDADTRAMLLAHDAETRTQDAVTAEKRRIRDAFQLVRNALPDLPSPEHDQQYQQLHEAEEAAIKCVLPAFVQDDTPLGVTIRKYVATEPRDG